MPVKKRGVTTPTVAELEAQVPCSPEAEASTLGDILAAGHHAAAALARARALLDPSDFFRQPHRLIFEALVRMTDKSIPIDLVTLKEELASRDQLDVVGGPAFIGSLIDGAVGASVEVHARIVKDKAIRRRLMERAMLLAGACTNGHETSELVDAGGALYREAMAADPEASRRCRPTGELLVQLAASSKVERGRRVLMQIPRLDRFTKGIAPGEVFTIVARPQVGKSALASKIALDAARAGERVIFYSLEMPREQCLSRLVQQALGLDDEAVENLARRDWIGLTPDQEAQLAVVKERILIIDRGKSGVEHLDASMTEAAALLEGAPRLAIIDYLGLLCSGAKNLPVYQRVSEAAIDCKSFAKRHDVAVILLSQAGREQDAKKTAGAAPLGIDAARDSGQVEEAADFLAVLWRPWLDPDLTPAARVHVKLELWLRLVKNRRGELGTVRLYFNAPTLHISDWPEAST